MQEELCRVRGRPKMAWMYGVKRAVEKRGVNVDRAKELACDRSEWRAFVKCANKDAV